MAGTGEELITLTIDVTEAADTVHGDCAPAFAEVARAFAENFRDGSQTGAGVSVYHRGREVVSLWGGVADQATGRPWRRDTLAVLASPTKSVAAGALYVLLERGVVELDAPIARYWPQFAAEGKGAITLRMLLAQQTGVVALDHAPITYERLRTGRPVVEALAAARPEWEPGTAHGYHAMTFGHILSEVVLRTTGRTVGEFLAEEIAGPLGLDCWIGLPETELPRLATMLPSQAEFLMEGAGEGPDAGDLTELLTALGNPESLTFRATIGSMSFDADTGDDAKRVRLENASYDGVANAPSLARYFAALIGEVDGVRLAGPALVDEIRRVHADGRCRTMLLPTTWGLGMMLPDGPLYPASAGPAGSFGLAGATGSFACAVPEQELAFAYVPNGGSRVIDRLDPRARRVAEAVHRSAARL
ncbi:serine hydrolase [Streptomyces sp. NPDC007904]|jgi:CubicO group peptidase (beta-lactamase class C family)|uniref:serine hydrolase domain-containing protein n=1 Tax=Streptomyces sp. NPDC007904 TaxID=3364787 RepID=UPI0036E54FC8